MQRRMVEDRIESADLVDATFGAHGGDLAAKLVERYVSQQSEGEPLFDYQAHLNHLRNDLATAKEELDASNLLHVQKLGEVVELRQERDRLVEGERGKFKTVRQTVEGLYGSEKGFPLAGVSGRTPRGAKGLARQMRQTADFLAGRSRALPPIEIGGMQIDPALMAVDLRDRAAGLRGVLVTLERVRKESQGCQKVKDRAMARFDQTFLWVARILEGLLNLVGEYELANRVRESVRRTTRRTVDDGDSSQSESSPESEEGQPAVDDPPADSSTEP